MSSIVLELQREVYEQQSSVSILLRKAYAIAKKLQVSDFEKWVQLELNGYPDNLQLLPEYRTVYGETKAFNPYNGYIPAIFQGNINEIINRRDIDYPITEIEDMIQTAKSKNSAVLMMNFPPDMQMDLMKHSEYNFQLSLHISTGQFQKIVDRVRNMILDWTLELEKIGVVGEGMTFNSEEKEKAAKSGDIIVNMIGHMNNSQIQQKAENSTQSQVIQTGIIQSELLSMINDIKKFHEEIIDQDTKQELQADIEVLESQSKSPKPKNGIIRETLKSVRNIAEGVTGSLIAATLQGKITSFINTIGG